MEGEPRRVAGRSFGFVAVGLCVLASVVVVSDVDAGWQRPHGDIEASNRVSEPAMLAGDPAHHPGFSEVLEIERPELPATRLHDVTGDGVPELLLPYRGRVGAIDMTQGGFEWQSGVAGIDSLVDFGDFDGDGSSELLAASRRVGGGLITVDPSSGAILSKTGPLPNRSGIDAAELSIADVDADGDDDVVYPAAFYGLEQLWVDGLGPDAEDWSASLAFVGYANITPVRVGRFVADAPPSLVLEQGASQQLFERCDETTPGAACGESACWCHAAAFEGVHAEIYAFGPAFVLDVHGDGVDEILTVASDARYTRSLSVFSPAQARAAGSGAAGQLWYRDYSQGTTIPATPSVTPTDLDGDGGIELLVSFVDNLGTDQDLAGQPIDDGIDHEGVSVGLFDAQTGQVEATLEDAFAHGWIDLDGDGKPEIVVSSVAGHKWQAGLRGYEFGCTDGCLEEVWSVPHSFAPTLVRESFDRQNVPTPAVFAMKVDDQDALIAYHEGAVHVLRFVDGQLVSVAERQLADEQSVLQVATTNKGSFALLSDERVLQLVDANLASAGPSVPIPGQGKATWTTAALDGFEAAIFEAKLYDMPLSLSGNFVSPEELLPNVALAENLDGVDGDEIIDFRRPEDELGPGFEVRSLVWDDGELSVRWSIDSEHEPSLTGFALSGSMQFATGNFDGQGSKDLVFMVFDAAREAHLVAVDGDSGAISYQQPAVTPATYTPLVVRDVASVDGTLVPDGIDDVLVDGAYDLGLSVFGHEASIWTQPVSFYHAVGAQADLDGDGRRELIATTSNTLENPGEALDLVGGALQSKWGSKQLGLPTGRTQVLSFAHVDGNAGLDLLYITGDGALELRNGQTGGMLPGSPVYLSKGQRFDVPDVDGASLGALMVIDVDNDGHDEAIVGADDGWVYALDIADEGGGPAPALEWSLEVGAPVSQLAAGDVDGDGFQELLVATESGQGFVLDSLGVQLDITAPGLDCIGVGEVEVDGTAHGVAFVDVYLNGELIETVAVEGGKWSVKLELPGPGEYEVRAEGRDEDGELVAIATAALCGDGEGGEEECYDENGRPCRFPDREEWRPLPRCHCSTAPEQRGLGFLPAGIVLLMVLRRRRRVVGN